MLVQIKKTKSWFSDFWVGMTKNSHSRLVHETLKSAYLKNEFMN